MKIAVLGTGMVGDALATKLAALGHQVGMGSRTAANEKAVAWAGRTGGSNGTFGDVASGAELIVNATPGTSALEALAAIAPGELDGNVILDISNPLDFSAGFPPAVVHEGGLSVAEQIQQAYPSAKVVKTLNTMNAAVMVNPRLVPGTHNTFIAGDDESAKATARELLTSFGWSTEEIIDAGGVNAARGLESYVAFWLVLMQAGGTPTFNIQIIR